jgi:hypothetical protein
MILSINAEFPKRFYRTQREAGIADKEWESRMHTRMSWLELICRAVIFGAIIAGIVLILVGMGR